MMKNITKLANLLKFILIMSWVLFPMDHSLLAYTHLRVNINNSATFLSLSGAFSKDLAPAFFRFNRADGLNIKKIII